MPLIHKKRRKSPPKRKRPRRRRLPGSGRPRPANAGRGVKMTRSVPVVPPPARPGDPPVNPRGGGDVPVFGRDIGNAQIKRLLWRAGFGPKPGQVDALAGKPLGEIVHSLTRPSGTANLVGPEPVTDDGPIAPYDSWGHDHLWWLDRMVRSDQQLVERMTLIWHDWFATSREGVDSAKHMIDQNELFRRHALGSFKDMLTEVTIDPAMLQWLNGIENRKGAPNENYARELMELFTLGANRGAYTEDDVRQLALALTGWRAEWQSGAGWVNFRYDDRRRDHSVKTVFGKSGDFGWQDAVRLVLENQHHASFFVTKLWSYFIPTPPDPATQASLQALYLDSGYGIRPVVEAILMHPAFYDGGAMVKPPVVYTAGLLRAMGRGVDREAWSWIGDQAGQRLFYPPHVAGWDDSAWLDTSCWRGRWETAVYAIAKPGEWSGSVDPWTKETPYDKTEDPETALARALEFLNNPVLTADTRDALLAFARTCLPATLASWQQSPFRAMRQNALRQLIATCPDYQTC